MTDPTDPAATGQAPERELERWTIDEIDELTVRVLICRALGSGAERDANDARTVASDAASPAEQIQDAVMAIEAGDPEATWSDETDVYVDRSVLEMFLAGRRDVAGLPELRPVREGDVFWVFVAAPTGVVADARPGSIPMGAAPGASAPTGIPPGAEIWDVTAAARQSIKRRYVLAAGVREPAER